MSKGFITGTNEELIKAYKESRDESYLKELIEANKGLINLLVSPYLTSIPNSELEDLTSESYIPMLRAIEDYDPEQGVAFSTLLKVYVRQHLNRLYNEATRQKRFTGTTLPVEKLADDDSVLFMWVTMPFLEEAFDVMRSWGFEYKTCAFTWIKQNKKADTLFWGMGNWTRANAELCLLGVRGKPKRMDAGVHSVIMSHIEEHSKKPAETRDRIVKLMAGGGAT